jgi:hypothetical protein
VAVTVTVTVTVTPCLDVSRDMTPEAKRALNATIRRLRERLLADLHDAVEQAYRLSVRSADANLPEAARVRRERLEGWLEEQARAAGAGAGAGARAEALAAARARFRREVERLAAATLVNRLVLLRLLEAAGLRRPHVVTGGWESAGYREFRDWAPELVHWDGGGDPSEGYAFLLDLVFADLATELPGLYGPQGVSQLVPLPPATLRAVVEALDDPALAPCWTDDLTLGWVYQYWNDPEREALDAKLNAGGKVAPHEVAAKTQMFTERYMVDWLLQNSLHPLWLASCQKHGWTPHAERDGVLADLEARRVEWRAKRDRQEVSLTELMPLYSPAERRWAYYVPQPIPQDAVDKAPESVRDWRILDPACGSGHFLVVALDLLFALYLEEAAHRGAGDAPEWSDRAIIESILERNLHGLDLDRRAVQLAAAALWLKAKTLCREARPGRLHLVASDLRLGGLPDDDPALVELRRAIFQETGIPADLTDRVVHALHGADHLGSLLKVDAAVSEAIQAHEQAGGRGKTAPQQGDLFGGFAPRQAAIDFDAAAARQTIEQALESFLQHHTAGEDLGLRLRGEQLAAGVRFVRLLREGTYDVVVGNPPYQGTSKLEDAKYVQKHYELGKADLYAAFLIRGLELARAGGSLAMITMRNWMFLHQFAALREWLLETYDLRVLGDLSWGAFEEMRDNPVTMSVARAAPPSGIPSVAVAPTDPQDRVRTLDEVRRKAAGLRCGVGRHEFGAEQTTCVKTRPIIYWWKHELVRKYMDSTRIGDVCPAREGLTTADNVRFLRNAWEACIQHLSIDHKCLRTKWVPYVKGAEGKAWFEPVQVVLDWSRSGMGFMTIMRGDKPAASIRNSEFYFRQGIAFTTTGSANSFGARLHRRPGVFDAKGRSVFPADAPGTLCCMNTSFSRDVLGAINPTIDFAVGDVNRLPLFPIANADDIYATLDKAFTEHESHREPSVEFVRPGPSAWRSTQDWAQRAVDRPENTPLPPFQPVHDPEPATDHLSHALGVALGRFRPESAGGGILDPASDDLTETLPHGILFLDGTLDADDGRDSLGHPAARGLRAAWERHGAAVDPRTDLRTWLRTKFFADVHRGMYENRPIHWPLSSEKKTFVAWVTIHRWTADTLRALLAEHLYPALARLEGELGDLAQARQGADARAARAAERRHAVVQRGREELRSWVAAVEQCAEQGPPPPDAKTPAREVDARYAPDLDDGVLVNAAALWPLLEPQWNKPKGWWKELASAAGRKDYDWSHLAMRYWPTRVDAKCQADPSLGVAHGCFWKYHPARAWAWELRLQDEIGERFRIEERDAEGYRAAYLAQRPAEALAAVEKEALRRRRKRKAAVPALALLESGLWAAVPDQLWALELRVIEKQGAEFVVTAPDEPAARAAFLAAHPPKAAERALLVAALRPAELALDEGEPDPDGGADGPDGPDGDGEEGVDE